MRFLLMFLLSPLLWAEGASDLTWGNNEIFDGLAQDLVAAGLAADSDAVKYLKANKPYVGLYPDTQYWRYLLHLPPGGNEVVQKWMTKRNQRLQEDHRHCLAVSGQNALLVPAYREKFYLICMGRRDWGYRYPAPIHRAAEFDPAQR